MFPQNKGGFGPAHAFRRHDLVSRGIFEDAILVDATLMRKSVAPDNGFIRLNIKTGNSGEQSRQRSAVKACEPRG